MTDNLRSQCNLILSGHHKPTPAELFSKMSIWCEENDIQHDIYGEGELIHNFEKKLLNYWGMRLVYL